MNIRKNAVDLSFITLGTLIIATAVFFFLVPSHLSVASISGLAIILSNFIPLPVSAITFILNGILLIVGFIFIGREFGAKTVYTSILLPAFIRVYELIFPNQGSLTGDQFVDMILYVSVVSIGLAMLFVRNASSGGLDIVAKLLNKFMHMDLGTAMSVAGMVVALSSFFVYDIKSVLLSIFGTYINGLVVDHFIFGFDKKRRVCILSDKQELIRDFIINELHSGATLYDAIGALNREHREEIVVIVDKQEYAKLIKFIKENTPAAFITVYEVSKMQYQPKPKGQP